MSTPKPSSKYARAKPPSAASYRKPVFRLPGTMNMPRSKAHGKSLPSFKKFR